MGYDRLASAVVLASPPAVPLPAVSPSSSDPAANAVATAIAQCDGQAVAIALSTAQAIGEFLALYPLTVWRSTCWGFASERNQLC